MVASIEDDIVDSLPDSNFSKEFYAKYEPKDILGSGVSSTVRRCVEKGTQTEFAVKIIDLTQEKDNEDLTEQLRDSTKQEMQVLRIGSEHPNIIGLHDAFESEAYFFLVFEICKKGELFDYLTQVVTLSEKRTRQIMRQLLSAVEFIHSQNIVHRDLKPENILMDDNLNVKLTDFGFATKIDHDEELYELCGTPGYLAPEALKVSMYDDAVGYGRPVDMWASGVIMYTMLVGCPPFWHRKQLIMVRMIMEGKYSFASPEWDDISENAKDLIAKLLVVAPKDRLTALEALNHPFFKREEKVVYTFMPRRKFKAGAYVLMAMNRISKMHAQPAPISVAQMSNNPYIVKLLRKAIDGGAFKIYGHWVKRGENQNRAALFESDIKRDIKLSTSSLDEQLQAHFDKFAPTVVVGDRVGKVQPHVKPKTPTAPAPEPGMARQGSGSRRGLFAKVAAKGKQLGQIREHDDHT